MDPKSMRQDLTWLRANNEFCVVSLFALDSLQLRVVGRKEEPMRSDIENTFGKPRERSRVFLPLQNVCPANHLPDNLIGISPNKPHTFDSFSPFVDRCKR